MLDPIEESRRGALSHIEQMADAQKQCLPCKLCRGSAEISDAGTGAGYYIRCENAQMFRPSKGCIISDQRLGGWAYNVMEWWNRLHAATQPPAQKPLVSAPANPSGNEQDMPKRIWAGDFDRHGFGHCVAGMQGGLYEEYVHADQQSAVEQERDRWIDAAQTTSQSLTAAETQLSVLQARIQGLEEALKYAEEEFNRIACEGVTETRTIPDAFERSQFFANRGAVCLRAALNKDEKHG